MGCGSGVFWTVTPYCEPNSSEEAHTQTLVALWKCHLDVLFEKHTDVFEVISQGHTSSVHSALNDPLRTMESCHYTEWIKQFDKIESAMKPILGMVQRFMKMVDSLLPFIWSVRTAIWNLHLAALQDFLKYFFAFDLTNYSAMIGWYLAEIKSVKKSYPDIREEFWKGSWVVKRLPVPFCAHGSDEALEHETEQWSRGVGGHSTASKCSSLFFPDNPKTPSNFKWNMLGWLPQK